MTTATYSRKIGAFQVAFDADPDLDCPWDVLDADGDVVDSFETKAEAVAYARELAAEAIREAAEEARQERLDDARSDIESALADCEDEAVLARVLAMLNAAKG